MSKPTWGSGHKKDPTPTTKPKTPDWLDPHYGYRPVEVGTKGHKHIEWRYVGQTQYLNEELGNAQLDGILDLLPLNSALKEGDAKAAGFVGGPSRLPGPGSHLTANQAMYLFKHADPGDRARVQAMMYRAGGLYSKKYVPTPGGPLTKQDIDAFRKFVIGVASNPGQGHAGDLLDQAASAGDMQGIADNSVYKPLVREVTNPQDIWDTANKVGQQLHGTYLTADQMKVFTSAYQTMEKASQEQKYVAEGGNLESGMFNPDNATGATVTAPASIGAQASQAIRTQNSTQFQANTFTDRLNEILQGLRGPNGNTTQVGPM